jgi:small subunit ribosomal protein S6
LARVSERKVRRAPPDLERELAVHQRLDVEPPGEHVATREERVEPGGIEVGAHPGELLHGEERDRGEAVPGAEVAVAHQTLAGPHLHRRHPLRAAGGLRDGRPRPVGGAPVVAVTWRDDEPDDLEVDRLEAGGKRVLHPATLAPTPTDRGCDGDVRPGLGRIWPAITGTARLPWLARSGHTSCCGPSVAVQTEGGRTLSLRHYEVMVILDPDLDERTVAPSLDTYLNVVKNDGGSVENVDVWGKRRLAYEIDKKNEGIYAVIDLTATPDTVKELDRQLGLNESVVRTKVTRPDVK